MLDEGVGDVDGAGEAGAGGLPDGGLSFQVPQQWPYQRGQYEAEDPVLRNLAVRIGAPGRCRIVEVSLRSAQIMLLLCTSES
jgi:hypothetical protein